MARRSPSRPSTIDWPFDRVIGPQLVRAALWAGMFAAIAIPVCLCVVAFQYSAVLGWISLLALPLMIVSVAVIIRLALDFLMAISMISWSGERFVRLIFGLDQTLEEVSGPANRLATGIRTARFWDR